MMENLRALLRIHLIMGWRSFTAKFTGTESRWQLVLLPLLLLAFIPLMIGVGSVAVGLYVGGKMIGQDHLVLLLFLTGGQIACLVFGIFYVISSFFFSKDLRLLVPLPIRPSEIVTAKFVSILVGEYLTVAPIVLPGLVAYGLLAEVSWTYLPFSLVIFLLLPVIPLAVAAVFSLLLMRVTNLKRSRDLFRVLGALLGVVLALGSQFVVRMAPGQGQREAVERFLETGAGEVVGRWVPTSVWAAEALREGATALGLPSFLLFTGVSVAALLLMLWVAERLFFGGLLGGDEVRSGGRALTGSELAAGTARMHSPLWALLLREVRLLTRTPSFLMAALIPLLMMPVFVAMPLIQDPDFGETLAKVQAAEGSPWVVVGAIAAAMLFSAMTNVGSTAISREGRYFWISRSLPVSPGLQVLAKLVHGMFFAAMIVMVILGALAFLRLLTPANLLYVLVGGFLASVATICAGMVVDILGPNLTWTDPQQAMKGNVNGLFAVLLMMGMGAVMGVVSAILYSLARPLLLPGLVVLFGVLAYGLYRLAAYLAEKRYPAYED